MTIFVFAPGRRVHPELSRISIIGTWSTPAKGVHMVAKEEEWGSTDFYCTLTTESASLIRRAIRLQASIIYLPRDRRMMVDAINHRQMMHMDSHVRLERPGDYDTMLALAPAPVIPLFGDE